MAFGNASAERAAIELTYEDTATVSRTTEREKQHFNVFPFCDLRRYHLRAIVYRFRQ